MNNTYNLAKGVMFRFARGFFAGAVSTMVTVTSTGVGTFADLKTFLGVLALAGIMGGITGSLLALDKYFRA